MSKKIDEFKKRCESNSIDPEYWLELEKDFNEFWNMATEKEKKKWTQDWGYGEILHMMCSGIRHNRGQEYSDGKRGNFRRVFHERNIKI